MNAEAPTDPCPVCGEKLIRVKLFARQWWECPNSVLECFNGMAMDGSKPFYDGPTHDKTEDDAASLPTPAPPGAAGLPI